MQIQGTNAKHKYKAEIQDSRFKAKVGRIIRRCKQDAAGRLGSGVGPTPAPMPAPAKTRPHKYEFEYKYNFPEM